MPFFDNANAVISPCRRYRYTLSRTWDATKPPLIFCMLNPSTADADHNDPTIRRCISFAQREGYGGIHVVNLRAWRATDPTELRHVTDPIGPDNAYWLACAADKANEFDMPIVCAWGAYRADAALSLFKGVKLVCLGKTQDGYPRHPLYVRSNQPLEPWP